jgi:hypothetical protein
MTGAFNAYQSLSLILDNCHIHGSNAYGIAGSQGTKIYYIGGEYDHNFMDTSGAINPNSDDGAHKNTHTPASYYVGAHVHDNQGQGLWWDHSNVNVYVALCNVHDNYGPGLFCEINDAAAGGDANNVAGNLDGSGFSFRFVFNTLTNNAAYPPVSGFYPTGNIYPSNLRVSRSNKLEIAYNIIADGTHALVLDFSTARGTAGHDLADIAVHDNDMLLRETASEPSANKRIGRVGFANSGGGGIPALVNVTFANNHYFADHDDSSWTHFMVEPSDADKTFTQWKALGYDTASTWAARAAWPH